MYIRTYQRRRKLFRAGGATYIRSRGAIGDH